MGVFDRIKEAIWGKEDSAARTVRSASAASDTFAPKSTPIPETAARVANNTAENKQPVGFSPSQSAPLPLNAASQDSSAQVVDVTAILDTAVKQKGQKLEWRRSIVDLMKALDLDSSLANRKELARELSYTGDTNDSATMNIWLHKALMKKLAENGGKVPADLAD